MLYALCLTIYEAWFLIHYKWLNLLKGLEFGCNFVTIFSISINEAELVLVIKFAKNIGSISKDRL